MADKKRTNQKNSGKPSAAQRSSGGKQTAARRAVSAEREDRSSLPAYILTGCISGVASVMLFFAVFGMNGFIFRWLEDFTCGIFGRTGFYVLPFALAWITCILFTHHKKRMVSRCVAVLVIVLSVGSFAQICYRQEVEWSFSVFKELYFGGMENTAAGVICGILGGVLMLGLGRGGTGVFLTAVLALAVLSALNMPIGSLIRAIRNRPRPEPLEPEDEKEEPATVLVNHIAQKHIERVERKRQIRDFDLPVDEPPVLTGEQQDFLAEPLPPLKKPKRASLRKKEAELSSDTVPALDPVPAENDGSAPVSKPPMETFDGFPITGSTVIPGTGGQQSEKPAPDLSEFEPLVPEKPEVPEEVEEAPQPEAEGTLEPPAEPEVLPDSKVKPEEARQEADRISREVAQRAAEEPVEYTFPPIELLNDRKTGSVDGTEEMRRNSQILQETLHSFKIDAQITNVTRGPSVTRYELKIDMGVRLAKVTALADDIALALGARGVRIAAIPDKQSVVGIEVPNRNVTMVPIRDVISSSAFVRARSKTSFALGKDISATCVIGDVASLPHLLIAGTTGSGKSVCMNSIIISFLYKSRPDEVKLIMVDPKMVELGVYNGIPHLLIPVVTDPKKAAGALQWAVTEMLRRYRLMSDAGCREVEAYNRQAEASGDGEKLPKIVVIIDELADLMMIAAKEVEESICRIAQMGRAAGIHLIIATQRPSANVITGLMKANIPSRVAFAVASAMESRIILDAVGAEKLVGKGDMLYAPLGGGKPKRVQGCFISDGEVEAVAEYVKSHYMASYNQDVIEEIERKAEEEPEGPAVAEDNGLQDKDELLPAAVDVIFETKQASVSMLQRRLKLGYARAARIVDEMEELGIVGPFVGSKPREIIMTREEWLQMQSGEPSQLSFDEDGGVPEEIP